MSKQKRNDKKKKKREEKRKAKLQYERDRLKAMQAGIVYTGWERYGDPRKLAMTAPEDAYYVAVYVPLDGSPASDTVHTFTDATGAVVVIADRNLGMRFVEFLEQTHKLDTLFYIMRARGYDSKFDLMMCKRDDWKEFINKTPYRICKSWTELKEVVNGVIRRCELEAQTIDNLIEESEDD